MVKAIRKPLEEIDGMIQGYGKVLVLGCGGCTSVCLVGGQRETLDLCAELEAGARRQGRQVELSASTVERQCDGRYNEEIADLAAGSDCIVSIACGVGAQHLSDMDERKPVFPGVNTMFIGADRDVGFYEERCRTCGNCQVGWTGGICPIARCSKSLLNGPCGGTHADGSCEVGGEVPCAWLAIHDRLKAQNRLDSMDRIRPPMEWIDKGPGAFVQRGYEGRYRK